MLINQQSGCRCGMNCSDNLKLNMKNQNCAHLICIQIVKNWSHIYQFSIYTAVKALQTLHQLLVKVVAYRLNSRMRVKYSGWFIVPYSLTCVFLQYGVRILILRLS